MLAGFTISSCFSTVNKFSLCWISTAIVSLCFYFLQGISYTCFFFRFLPMFVEAGLFLRKLTDFSGKPCWFCVCPGYNEEWWDFLSFFLYLTNACMQAWKKSRGRYSQENDEGILPVTIFDWLWDWKKAAVVVRIIYTRGFGSVAFTYFW